jgi:hypothetical protein
MKVEPSLLTVAQLDAETVLDREVEIEPSGKYSINYCGGTADIHISMP